MQTENAEIKVPSRKVEGVELEAGQQLVSVEGVVWVTSSIDGRDILLGPGDSVRFPKKGRAVVGGLRGRGVTVRLNGPTRH